MPELIIPSREAVISANLSVRRILPFRRRRMVGPFIYMDHAGPLEIPAAEASAMDVLPHPHIGLSTVTYLFSGRVTHRDSLGVEQEIRPGEVNWMTAGRGISHSERFEDPELLKGGTLEMLQTWVALPEEAEESEPEFNNYQPEQLPVFTDTGVWMRLIAGSAYGLQSAVRTHSPLFYLHVRLDKGAKFSLPGGYSERGAYIVSGSLEVSGRSYPKGQMLVFAKGDDPVLKAAEDTVLMLTGGEPLGERFIWWNFVSSRRERIEQAKNDWMSGKIQLPPSDNKEFIPLPEDRLKPGSSRTPSPEPLS